MLRSLKDLQGYTVQATDGKIGHVEDFYFDDHAWTVRYVVVDLGNWLPGRRVLISPLRTGPADWQAMALPVMMSKEQIEQSPGIGADLPVALRQRIEIQRDYVWAPYWPPVGTGMGGVPLETWRGPHAGATEEPPAGDPRLRSVREVINYRIRTSKGGAGHIEDFIAETEGWLIVYLVVDTRNWLPSKKTLVSPDWVSDVDWAKSEVDVDLSRDAIRDAPEYDPTLPVNREYEARVYDFYGRPKYWE